ncbi:MAG: hypothetical protein V5A55_14235 [Halovenus sp.]
MPKVEQKQLNSEDWITVRDFDEDDEGLALSRYEAKYVANVGKDYVENDLVVIKETDKRSGCEQMYHLPREAIQTVADRLP